MEYLILGIDGGDLSFFSKLKKEMPYLNKLIDKNISLSLTEDLINRGWAEIISGNHARDNMSFYIRPQLDGSKNFTLKYSFDELQKNNEGKLIWEIAEQKGYRAGIMNIPTTYPATKTEGFFISGAGGGLYKVDGIPIEMCDSENTQEALVSEKYIIEERFKPSGIVDLNQYFDLMNEMLRTRFMVFKKLCIKNQVSFGFLALRATANLLYLSMSEVEKFLNGKKLDSNIKFNLEKHFQLLDSLIKKMFTELNPKNFIITSDHGLVSQTYQSNYNLLLEENELFKTKFLFSPTVILKNGVKNILNFFGKKYPLSSYRTTDWSNTKVFGKWYSNGLYVNDEKRFKGNVKEEEISKLVDETCDIINDSKEFKEFKIRAIPYRRNYENSKFYDHLPDIKIDAADEIFFLGKGKKVVNENSWFGNLENLNSAPSSMLTGTKGRHPICIMNKELSDLIKEEDEMDLTIVYHLIKRHIELNKR